MEKQKVKQMTDADKENLLSLVNTINKQINSGMSKDEIIEGLINSGDANNKDEALEIVEFAQYHAINKDIAIKIVEVLKSRKMKAQEKNPFASFVLGIVSLIIVFAIFNGLLYGAQAIYHWNDVKKCEKMENELAIMKTKITKIEDIANERELELEEINQLGTQLEQGISTDFNKYDRLIKKFNSDASEFENMIQEYDELIENYNEIVGKYNALASSAYRRWWLIPIPLPGKNIHIK
jgi:DNA repair exonuclease SbcCD ATPase subunit